MFNIKTSKRIYTFKAAGESKINIMIKTPHLNVIGGELLRNNDVIMISCFSWKRGWNIPIDQFEKG